MVQVGSITRILHKPARPKGVWGVPSKTGTHCTLRWNTGAYCTRCMRHSGGFRAYLGDGTKSFYDYYHALLRRNRLQYQKDNT